MAGVKDFEWIDEHYAESLMRYPDIYIAVSNRKVLAAGKDFVTDYLYSGEPFALETHL